MTYHYSMQIHRIQLSPLALWQSAGRRSLRYQPRAMSMEAINIQLAFGFINDFIAAIRRGSNREWGAGGVNKGVRCVAALCSSANCGKLSLACCCCRCCVCVCRRRHLHIFKRFLWHQQLSLTDYCGDYFSSDGVGPQSRRQTAPRREQTLPDVGGGSLQGGHSQHPVGNTCMLLA